MMTGKTLDDMRSWLTGNVVEGLPHRDLPGAEPDIFEDMDEEDDDEDDEEEEGEEAARPRRKVDMEKLQRGRFEVLKDGRDAKLMFGRFSGYTISELAKGEEDKREYLRWLLTSDFPNTLKTIVSKYVAKRAKKARR